MQDKRILLVISGFIFLIYEIWQAGFGFGEDTDAWLMAQTAEKLRLGLGYDPARSFGNPLFEFALALFQTGNQWWFSNLFNLLLFIVLLIRIPFYFPHISENQTNAFRFLLLIFPVFLKNATASIEFVPGLFFLLEANRLILKNQTRNAFIWTVAASLTRLEFFPLIILTQVTFWQRNWRITILPAGLWLGYLFWAHGKNPLPFSGIEDGLTFYFARVAVLIETMGFSILFFPVLLFALAKAEIPESWRMLGMGNFAFFCFFPFEWEYAFPFFFISLYGTGILLGFKKAHAFAILFLASGFFKPEIRNWRMGEFSVRFEWPHESRRISFDNYCWAQQADFEQKTIFLEGATLFPYPVSKWEKVMDNRIFHRKNSNFYVGERLTKPELDSLVASGFQIGSR